MVPSVKVKVWESRVFVGLIMHFLSENTCTTSVWLVTGFLIQLISAIMEAMIYITRYMFVQEFHFHFPLDQLTIV